MKVTSTGGFSLLEITIAVAVALVLLATISGVVMATTESMDFVSRNGALEQSLKRALEMFLRDFRGADSGTITIQTANADHDAIRFQVVGPYDGMGVKLGANGPGGVFQEGWETFYYVNAQSELIRELHDDMGSPAGTPQTVAAKIDGRFDAGSGVEKGFSISRIPKTNLYDIVIRMRDTYRDGEEMWRDVRTTVKLRN